MDGFAVLVTGAASGIGNACVTRLLRDGALVVGFDCDAEGLEKRLGKAQPSLTTLHGDIADRRDCAAAVDLCVERFGKISALIHCAGIHSSRFWTDLEVEERSASDRWSNLSGYPPTDEGLRGRPSLEARRAVAFYPGHAASISNVPWSDPRRIGVDGSYPGELDPTHRSFRVRY